MNSSILDLVTTNSPHLSWMKDNTIFLTVHGSTAYGTNTPESDTDYKGVCIPTKQYLYGYAHKFEQAELKAPNPDAVIYDIRKFFNLASACNPSIIEVLFTDPSDHVIVSPIGEILLKNRDKFLSKRVRWSFLGYAISQLNKIKLHRRHIVNPPKAPPTREEFGLGPEPVIPQDQMTATFSEIQKQLDRINFDFMEGLDEPTKIEIRMNMNLMISELKITNDERFAAAARKIGLDDNFIEVMKKEHQFIKAKREWEQFLNWKKNRNPKRYAMEEKFGFDGKFALHSVRLARMAKEMLLEGKVIVKRPDREELLSIRNGGWTYDQLMEFADSQEQELDSLYKTSNALPHKPDQNYLDNLCIQLVEMQLGQK